MQPANSSPSILFCSLCERNHALHVCRSAKELDRIQTGHVPVYVHYAPSLGISFCEDCFLVAYVTRSDLVLDHRDFHRLNMRVRSLRVSPVDSGEKQTRSSLRIRKRLIRSTYAAWKVK